MRPMHSISDLITEHMSVPGDAPEQKPESDYIVSGLRDAIFANLILRRQILSDVAEILQCSAEDLEFLYTDVKSPAQAHCLSDFIVPDFRTRLLDAAE